MDLKSPGAYLIEHMILTQRTTYSCKRSVRRLASSHPLRIHLLKSHAHLPRHGSGHMQLPGSPIHMKLPSISHLSLLKDLRVIDYVRQGAVQDIRQQVDGRKSRGEAAPLVLGGLVVGVGREAVERGEDAEGEVAVLEMLRHLVVFFYPDEGVSKSRPRNCELRTVVLRTTRDSPASWSFSQLALQRASAARLPASCRTFLVSR